ncbi:unnamed protein product [Durusdinium trenchii]|uniref:CASP-like protein n=1 Tax=Durusdinium trenchii TaxID=1381693 RepID=A0ABP0JMY4_9DINO
MGAEDQDYPQGGSGGSRGGGLMKLLGYNFFPASPSEVESTSNRVLVVRLVQFILALVSLIAAAGSEFTGTGVFDWALACAILAWLFVMTVGVCGVLSMKGFTGSPAIQATYILGGLVGDSIFMFLTMSAATAAAAIGSVCNQNLSGAASDICSAPRLTAAMLFLLCFSFIYSAPLSLMMVHSRDLVPATGNLANV